MKRKDLEEDCFNSSNGDKKKEVVKKKVKSNCVIPSEDRCESCFAYPNGCLSIITDTTWYDPVTGKCKFYKPKENLSENDCEFYMGNTTCRRLGDPDSIHGGINACVHFRQRKYKMEKLKELICFEVQLKITYHGEPTLLMTGVGDETVRGKGYCVYVIAGSLEEVAKRFPGALSIAVHGPGYVFGDEK